MIASAVDVRIALCDTLSPCLRLAIFLFRQPPSDGARLSWAALASAPTPASHAP